MRRDLGEHLVVTDAGRILRRRMRRFMPIDLPVAMALLLIAGLAARFGEPPIINSVKNWRSARADDSQQRKRQ